MVRSERAATPPRARLGAVALALAGLLFAAFPLVRPFYAMPVAGDVGTLTKAAEALTSPAWVASHLLAGAALILLPLGALALAVAVEEPGRRAVAGQILTAIGSGLLLVVIGGETFGLPAAAQAYAAGESADLVALVERVRNPALFATLLLGLVILAAGGITLATAIWRSGLLPRAAGVLLAIGLVLWMPLLPQVPRVIDGLFIGVGSCWLAAALWRRESAPAASAAHGQSASSLGAAG